MQEIEEAKEAGIPVTAQALQAPLPPPEQNAAPLYTQLTALIAAHPLAQEDLIAEKLTARAMLTEEQLKRARKALQHRSDLLTLLHKAAARPQCVFVRDWSYPAAVKMTEFSTMRNLPLLLVAESLLLAHDGKPLDAVRNQALGFRIARHVAPENFSGYMYAVGVDSITLRGLQDILYLAGNDPAVADAVRLAVEKDWTPHSLARAFRNMAGVDVVSLQILRAQGPAALKPFLGDNTSPPIHMKPQEWNTLIDDNGALLLRQQRKAIAVADLSYPESAPVLNTISNEVDQDKDPRHLLILDLADNYPQYAEQQARAQTLAAETRTAALLAWKDRHGSFPQTLEEALTPVPVDPFDGKPLRYRREGAGFVVYTVGKEGTFTGGTPDTKPGRFEVAFRYPLPAYYKGPLKED